MRKSTIDILRQRDLRLFFTAWGASSIGSGAGYVALLFAVQQRFGAGWPVGAVLLAQFAPAMLFGVALGRQVDRRSRRRCAIVADLLGAGAFVALAVAGTHLAPVIALSAVAGFGTAVMGPAHMAMLPRLAGEDRLAPATALYGIAEEAGYFAGPLLAAAVLAAGGPSVLLLANAASFVVSALALARLPHDAPAPAAVEEDGAPARGGALRLARGLPVVAIVLSASAVAVVCVALTNVGEVAFVTGSLGAGGTGLSLILAVMAAGTWLGSATPGTSDRSFRVRYVAGLLAMGAGLALTMGTLVLPLVLVGVFVTGWGNGSALTHERLLLQHAAGDEVKGRVFGLRKSVVAWAFCVGYALTGPLAAAGGGRLLLGVAGALGLVAAAWAGARLLVEPAPSAARTPA